MKKFRSLVGASLLGLSVAPCMGRGLKQTIVGKRKNTRNYKKEAVMTEPSYKYEYTWCVEGDLQEVLDRAVQEGRELISTNREAQPSLITWHLIWKVPIR